MKKYQKKGISLICALGIFTTVFSSAAGYFGGTVTAKAEEAITISTAEELQKIGVEDAYPLSGDYVLGADIDLGGIDFTPIGGGTGERGADSGKNVFTGTFDGNGHVISNLTIEEAGTSEDSWQYGLFGMIGSSNADDCASVKNLILTGVDISVDLSGNGYLSLGALAGEVNHNAVIDNVAVVDGTVEGNPSNGGDVVGIGGLIGEMRYSTQTQGGPPGQQTTSVNGVTVSNVYVGADVISGSSKENNYTAGIIGRIAKSNPTSVTACVYTGNSSFKSSSGYGISGGDMTTNINNCYYISGTANTGTAVSEDALKAGTLLTGCSESYWTAEKGSYMVLAQCMASDATAGILALSGLSLELAEGDSLLAVTTDFKVPTTIQIGETTEKITWTTDQPEILSIGEDGIVTVSRVYADTDCTLTATTESAKTKNFRITVATKVAVKIEQEYARVGESLTVSMVEAPEDMDVAYTWSVDGVTKATGTTYTPTSEDLEKMLTVTATASGTYTGTYQAQMYISKLPVLYVNTEGGQAIVSKEDYINGDLKIQGNEQYNSGNTTLYDGIMEIRGRGNTTWGYPKKPYKMKLDAKTDIFGFGANKHWVLLANYTDEAHMRNKLAYDLSGEMGMPYMQSAPVDLILNGEYQGTYQFCEQVKISDARIDIFDWEDYAEDVAKAIYKVEKENGMSKDDRDAVETILAENDLSWMTTKQVTYKENTYNIEDYISDMPAATGGFLMELDGYFDETSKFKSSKQQPLMFKSPEFVATNSDVMEYVEDYINAFEQAIDASDYTTTYNSETVSYSQLFDMDSLVQFWMVQELFMNVDAMKKSTYLYKDINGKFYMGPIWDMDWSSNSLVSQYQGSGTYNTWQTTKFSDAAQANQWYKSIIKDPYFSVKAYELYTSMRDEMGTITADGGKMDTYKELILESANANANLWYSGESNKNFTTQTTVLKNYLKNRLNWMDSQFTSPENLAASLGYTSAGGITVDAADIVTKDSGATVITAKVTNTSVKAVEFLVNGEKAGTVEVSEDKTAAIEVPKTALAEAESYNTVQVFGLNASGSVITSSNKKVTDFAAFMTDSNPDSGNPDSGNPDSGNPDSGDSDSGNPDSGNPDGGNQDAGNQDNGNKDDGNKDDGNKDNGNGGGTVDTSANPKVTSVTFAETAVTVPKGETTALTVTVAAPEGADKTVTYQSSDSTVAAVSSGGTVTAIKAGTAVITAMAGGLSAECTITVAEVKLNVTSAPMQKGQKTTAIKIKSKYPADDTAVSWKSSKSSVATVSSSGKITAKKTGTAVITVTMKSGAKASCKVTVKKGQVKTTKVTAASKSISLKKGKTYQIVPQRTPVTANDKLTYTVKDKKIVSVSSKGKIKALKKGTTKVTVKSGSKKVQIIVKVK